MDAEDKHTVGLGVAQLLHIIEQTGENAELREGLQETPARVAKAWEFWTSGYHKDPKTILKSFEDGAEGCDEMVARRNIPVYSKCEHHLADIFGFCTVAYIPNGRVVGLSKMDRLVDMFARRLQVQERMTNQIADAMWEHLNPLGVGVWLSARHMCVESRGVQNANSQTETVALRGVFKTQSATRAEFLALAHAP
jgi:GTP cyclohydrolase I